jgi:DNA-binding FadR family transcriptional regulator
MPGGSEPLLQKIEKTSLVEKVCQQLESAILTGEYGPGDRLPTTRSLQTMLGASLGSIREALAILQQKGLITVKKGTKGGAFVREPSTAMVSESLELLMRQLKLTPRELSEFRRNVEGGLIRLVLKRATDQEIQNLAAYREKLRACLGRGETGWYQLLRTEHRLRREMIVISANRTYQAVLSPIHDNIVRYASKFLKGNEEMAEEAFFFWDQILSAVENRDGDTAAAKTEEMIECFLEHMNRQGSDLA